MSKKFPSYRRKKSASGDYAIVTLPDGAGARRDVLLGRYGTPESRQEYLRVLAEWEANGCRLPKAFGADITINELILAYWLDYKKTRPPRPSGKDGESYSVQSALRPLKELYGQTPVAKFGPLALRAVRERMVASNTPAGRPWSRGFVNSSIARVKAAFKWGVEHELVDEAIFNAIYTMAPLKRGRTSARETEDVKPVPDYFVDATIPHTASPVAAMIRLQRLTGMRPGEVVVMRAVDFDMSGHVWFYTPEFHKNEWRGHSRLIAIGPQAQEIIKPFLTTDLSAYLFTPQQSKEERRQKLRDARIARKGRIQPSQIDRRKKNPKRAPRERYDVDSYRQAIQYATAKADAFAHREQPDVPAEERIIPDWSPNRLRHTAATHLRKRFGLDAARVILGHRSAQVTEIYAEIDQDVATKIMAKIG